MARARFQTSQLHLWVVLHQSADLISAREDAEYSKVGLTTAQYVALVVLFNSGSPIKPSELAASLSRSGNTVTNVIDRLESKGYVQRLRNHKDRRVVNLVITERGKEKYWEASELGWNLIRETLSNFSSEDLDDFTRLLEKLRQEVIEKHYPERGTRLHETVYPQDADQIAQFTSRSPNVK